MKRSYTKEEEETLIKLRFEKMRALNQFSFEDSFSLDKFSVG